ncbi:MAG: RNB domain-containing ribonuclease [Acidobacteriota bacterium]|nr:RNB domain-containing ribonuclease [Acidobacteriota bacterium]
MKNHHFSHVDLESAARMVMLEHGFEPEFPDGVAAELERLQTQPPALPVPGAVKDLRGLLWSSIDNDSSRDLDQIEYAEKLPGGGARVLIAIADVDVYAARDTAMDQHAAKETTSVYTGVRVFPMLPEELSTNITSLLPEQDRHSIVIEFNVSDEGMVEGGQVYRALTRNKAKLAYNSTGAWLEGRGEAPHPLAHNSALQGQLRLQGRTALALRAERFRHGALNIESAETHPVMEGEEIVDVVRQEKNEATELIEDFMVAANGVVARLLHDVSSIRRVVKTPQRWGRIVELAGRMGEHLPAEADPRALNGFLLKRKKADPERFPDLSLAIIKLMGPGEYVLERPGDPEEGHFGLAVQDYTHSTAPNRRFADLVTQRLLKALMDRTPAPYSDDDLGQIAAKCTLMENMARKVEREMNKRIAAVAMRNRIGEVFPAIATGVNEHGTFVRIARPHVEGMLVTGHAGIDVGDHLRVRLVSTDVQRGFLDFARV